MKAKDINIEQFKSIGELYSFIDDNAFKLERNWELTNMWMRFRNAMSSETEKQKAQWEIDCLVFDIKGNRLFSQIYSEVKDIDQVNKYPDLNKFQTDVIEYIKDRAITSNNPLLKARYNHLLWKCPIGIKHNSYALTAIENYIAAIKGYLLQYETDKHKETPYQIGRLYETLVAVSNEVKSDTMPLKTLTKYLLFEAKGLRFNTRHGILKDMLEFPKLFKPDDFHNALSLFENELNKTVKPDDFQLVHYYFPAAVKIATKVKLDVRRWHNETGLAYLRMAETETQADRYWIKQENHFKAIEAFKLAGNENNRKKAEQLYADLKPKVKLPTIRIDFDEETQKQLKDFQEKIKKLAESILKHPASEVYRVISNGYFFPKYSDVVKASENQENAFLDFVTTIHFDNNKNISSLQDEKERKVFETYGHHIRMSVLPYLHYIIIPGIKSGHLTFENFMAFIAHNSWIGKPHIKSDLGEEEKPVNWIGLLSPAIVEFFVQMQGWLSSKYYTPSFVLCIDSLTLKMEGLFRDFCERVNIPTSTSKQKGMQEIYVHNVLENEALKQYFNEDDLLFFNYLFSNEGGINLRNNIAHCFYDYEEYHPDKMLLLIAALLRLAKYDYNATRSS